MTLVSLVNNISVGVSRRVRATVYSRDLMSSGMSVGNSRIERASVADRDIVNAGISAGKAAPNELKDMTVLIATEV